MLLLSHSVEVAVRAEVMTCLFGYGLGVLMAAHYFLCDYSEHVEARAGRGFKCEIYNTWY